MYNRFSLGLCLMLLCNVYATNAASPIVTGLSTSNAYYGMVISVYGTDMNKVNAITIGGTNMNLFTIVSVSQIDITINSASASGNVILSYLGGTTSAGNFTFNGYITCAGLNYLSPSCWFGAVVPPPGAVISIAHNITMPSLSLANAPSTIRVLSGASITTLSGSTIFQSSHLQIDNGGIVTIGPNSIWNLNAGNLTNNGTINFSSTSGGIIRITSGTYLNNGVLNQGLGRFDFYGTCVLHIANITLQNLEVNGSLALTGSGTLQVNGDLQLNGALNMGSSTNLAIKGDIFGTGVLTANSRKLICNGNNQSIHCALTLYDLEVQSKNLSCFTSLSIQNKLSVQYKDTLIIRPQSVISVLSGLSNQSVNDGTILNQGSLLLFNSNALRVGGTATFIHNATSAIANSLSKMVLLPGSTFVYRGNANLIPTISVSGRSFHHLIFESTSGSWTDNVGFTGNANCTINGDLIIGNGVTLVNASYSGFWQLNGSLIVSGAMPANGLNMTFIGLNYRVSGIGTIRFNHLIINGFYTLKSSLYATVINVNGQLNMESNIISGQQFNLLAGAHLGVGHVLGITNTGNLGNVQTSLRNYSKQGSYIYNGVLKQISGNGLPDTIANLTVNKYSNDSNNCVLLSRNIVVTNTLNLIDGRFVTPGSVEIYVSNPSVSAVKYFTPMSLVNTSGFIEGNLRRKVQLGKYEFPVGVNQNYELASIVFNSNTNVDNILVRFDKYAYPCGYAQNKPSFFTKPTNGVNYSLVNDMLDYGCYVVEPYDTNNALVVNPVVNYDVQMLFNGHTNSLLGYSNLSAHYTLMKRPSCNTVWGLYGGTFNTNFNQAQVFLGNSVILGLQGLVSFSQFGAGFSSGTILPLEMTNFVGEQVNGTNQLSWTTLSEESTIKFVIERSENADDFTAIGEVAAKGARNSGADYSFLDEKAGTGIHYYRLKAVDVDANVSYSEMIALGTKGAISNFNVYPNPSANEIHFAYQLLQANTQATLKVYSMTGALMHAEVLSKNNQVYLLDTRDYQNGLYFYEILSGGQKLFTGKFDISK